MVKRFSICLFLMAGLITLAFAGDEKSRAAAHAYPWRREGGGQIGRHWFFRKKIILRLGSNPDPKRLKRTL